MKNNNFSLFIDTTQDYCALGLINDKQVINLYKEKTNHNMTDIVITRIKKFLKQNRVSLEQIKNIYLVNGPGSFTGSRVGFLITVTWCSLKKINLYTTNSLLFQLNKGTGISLIDAKSQKQYLAIYSNFKPIVKPCLIDNNELDKYLNEHKELKVIKNYHRINYKAKINQILKYMEKVNDLETFTPIYLKDPV